MGGRIVCFEIKRTSETRLLLCSLELSPRTRVCWRRTAAGQSTEQRLLEEKRGPGLMLFPSCFRVCVGIKEVGSASGAWQDSTGREKIRCFSHYVV